MPSTDPVKLSEHYYLRNFRVLAEFVDTNYRHLLATDEQDFYHHFLNLPNHSQQLYVRLLMRRRNYIRTSKLHYPEIDSVPDALSQLHTAGYLQIAVVDELDEWIDLYTKNEIGSVLSLTAASKEGLDTAHLTTTDLLGDTPLERLLQGETVYSVEHQATFQIYQLLFFGNLYQDLSEFVVSDLGIRRYERYLTDTSHLPFQSRDQLHAYLQYYLCAENFENAAVQGTEALLSLQDALPKDAFDDPILQRRLRRFSNKVARQLERDQSPVEALAIYSQNSQPPSRERQARINAQLGEHKRAYDICETIKQQSTNIEELEFASDFQPKLAKKLKLPADKPNHYQPPVTTLSLPPTQLPVEYASALHFAKHGHCYYVENTLITSMLGLAIWDIIFAPVSGVFYHPFQRSPADFREADFCTRRQSLINARIELIATGKLRQLVLTHYHCKRGMLNPLVHWQAINVDILSRALKNIPTKDWLALFQYMLSDLKNHRSGLPDLIFFPNEGGYQLIEIKGPGDKLQKNQRRWMKHFNKHGIAHAVVDVDFKHADNKTDTSVALPTHLIQKSSEQICLIPELAST